MKLTELVKHKSKTAKILTLDIERLGGTARGLWGPKQTYISHHHWTEMPRTICWSARWYNNPNPMFGAEWEKGGHQRMLSRIWELYDEADVVVGYNQINFDNKHLRGEWFEAGLQTPSPWKDVDLLKVVRRQFGWEFKSLDAVTKRLGAGGKRLHYDADMAYDAIAGDKEAQETLKEYNLGDIELTEWLYDRLRGWIPNHPQVGDFSHCCENCGGTNLELQESTYVAVMIDYELWRCADCGKYHKGAYVARKANLKGV